MHCRNRSNRKIFICKYISLGKIELFAATFSVYQIASVLNLATSFLRKIMGNSRIKVIDSRGTSLRSGVEVLRSFKSYAL